MAEKEKSDISPSIFNKRIMKFLAIATVIVIIIVFSAALIKYRGDISNTVLSDYFFVTGTILLIFGVLMRTMAWIIHKRFVLKPKDDNESDVYKARVVLKFLSKTSTFIGVINIAISLIFLTLYFNK